jgi:hypothetical protein
MPAIPERIVELIHGPAFMQIATRDASLRPAHAWVVGGRVGDDRETVTVFVPAAAANRNLENLGANGRIALGVALATHEAYQLKGTYVSHRVADADDLAVQERYRAALFASALAAGYPEDIARPFTLGFAYTPAVAITFRAEQVFRQTPGPDAGAALSSRESA